MPAALALALALMAGAPRQAAGEDPAGYQEKARLLYSFARNSEWPKKRFGNPEAPFVIGIYGADMISEFLRELVQNARLKDRPVQVITISAKAQVRACHMLFVSRSERDRLKPILSEARREQVLTVGECENFLNDGGMINFVDVQGSIGYEVKISNANDADLTFRGQLLQYAHRPDAETRSNPFRRTSPPGPPAWQ